MKATQLSFMLLSDIFSDDLNKVDFLITNN